uniref:TonB-dependent receptor n=1 Tax=Roseihalotalea indica TaxID=2867963 RepID=A0AA49GPG5_9BACT|nr:TonB-dependent receptor [Tunicatimonas sp. TK19036]
MSKIFFGGFLLQMVLLSTLLAFNGVAQGVRNVKEVYISLNMPDATLLEIFQDIENKTDFYFSFDRRQIDNRSAITLQFDNTSVAEVLLEVSKISKLKFKQLNNTIHVSPVEQEPQHEIEVEIRPNLGVSGQVTSLSDNTGLPGVNVLVKGTSVGTITDVDGNYTINVPNENDTLIFSSVGFIAEEIPVNGRSTIDITLAEDIQSLSEVVVIGYGSQIAKEVTGAVQQIDAEQLKDLPVAQITQKLQGRMAGVQINQATGAPGQGMQVRIRGQASVNAGNDPLYVVDGFPIVGDISTINPDEIESISVLKDAASTSLYGSRAANGVILITTKSGTAGQPSFSFNSYVGVQQVPQRGRPDMMNATEFAQFLKERYEDRDATVPDYLQNPAQYGEGTDWYDAMLQTAPIQNYNLTLATGSDRARTSGVLGYFSQDGVMKNSNFERYSFRLNSEFSITDQVKLGVNLAPNYSVRNSPNSEGAFFNGGIIYNAMLANPMVPYQNEDGSIPLLAAFPGIGFATFPNPYRALTDITNETKILRLLANSFIDYSPLPGLSLKSTINVDAASTSFLNFQPTTTSLQFWIAPPRPSQSTRWNENYLSWLNENLITYTKEFGDHNLSVLGGFSVQNFSSTREQIVAQEFSDDRIQGIQTVGQVIIDPDNTSTNIQEWSLLSFLARLNYNYKGKYLLTASIRRDGSSRFGTDNRWGNFPSVSAGWVLSDEPFMSDANPVSFLKLRGSYGVVGNNNIGNYTQYANVSITNNVVYNGVPASGSAVVGIENKGLGWETTRQIDVGLDVGLLDDRITFTYDYYTKNTTNLLYNVDVPQESGFTNISSNLGEFKFWGHEFTLNSRNLTGELRWTTDFNISFNRNQAVSLIPGVDRLYDGFGGGAYATLTVPGEPIGQFWGMDWIGVYEDQEDFDSSPKAQRSDLGTIQYRDVNGDGRITFGGDEDDRTFIGNPTPDFIYGITNTFQYKNFDLSIVCSGSYGNDVFVMLDQGAANLDGIFNVYKDVQNRWRPGNPGAGRYGASIDGISASDERDWGSDRFVDDGSYFAIKNLTLGYNLPVSQGKALKNVRFYGSIQQLALFTNYRGVNPEISTTDVGDTNVSALQLGFDYGAYPIPRTYTLGVNVGF